MLFAMLAISVMSMCSFLLKGPGLRLWRVPKSVMPTSGSVFSHSFPSGYASSWGTLDVTLMAGWRMPKKPLMKAMAPEKRIPRTQARMVEQGIVGSSLLSTTLRTSAYGEFVVIRAAWIFISEICCSCFSGWSKMPSLSEQCWLGNLSR